ncbi:type I site-specific deoxyribonuclease [Rodentibacter rarus]|uniref:Type I site-specific deoxyribonuclease n=1 Tax=Rodentibacter rarus TaxID=1908260 RepID=A0A1V3ILE3_9PAST|nr:restriction endonuclease subunit S [Rodentibacter rarus]OOF42114.1 type I site-specific deoxyribonuclease [Rodentibacter rarus]
MSDWKMMKLSEVATIVGGGTPSSSKTEYFENGEIAWITPKDLSGYNKRYISKGERNITELGLKNSSAKLLPKDTVLLTSRAPIGYVAIASNEISTNQGFKSLILNEGHIPEFFYYLLKNNVYLLESRAIGSTFKEISGQILKDTELNIPDFDTQQKIVDILSPLDEKIELNTQINQTLEQIAQAIFKSWFVDFDPVRAKANALAQGKTQAEAELAAQQIISGKTPEELTALSQTHPDQYAELAEIAKAFPSEFEEIDGFGEVPRGWEVKRIDEIATVIKGKSYKSSELAESTTALVTLKSFNRGGGYRLDGLKEYIGKYKYEQEVFSGELIIAYTDVTQAADVIGKPAMVMSDSRYEHLVISLDVGVVRPFDDVYKYFLYCLAMTDSFQAHTKSFCTGTTVLHLGKDAVPSFEFVNPNYELLKVFWKQTSPIFEKINLNIEENKSLEKSRDLLLPRLLNGEI